MKRLIVRCHACELRQFSAESCRRCGKSLAGFAPAEVVVQKVEVEKVVKRVVERVVVVERLVPASALDVSPRSVLFGLELPTLEELEAELVKTALERAGGNASEAARICRVSKTTMYRKIAQLGMEGAA